MINKALDLQEVMETRHLVDPYLMQLEPPADLGKLKRHFMHAMSSSRWTITIVATSKHVFTKTFTGPGTRWAFFMED